MKNIRRIACFLLLCLALTLLAACAAPPEETTPPPEETAAITQQEVFADVEGILAMVVYYPTEAERDAVSAAGAEGGALQILDDSDGVHYDEVLIVPKFGDCKIWLEGVEFNEETGAFLPTGDTLGSMDGTGNVPSQAVGGVLVRTLIPEGIPNKQVVVSRNGQTGTFLLGYDGKGDGHYYIRAWEES